MIMMSLYFTNTIPFKHIYINSIVRDADGQKMSKSKGNTLDPLDIIDGIDFDALLDKSTKGILIDGHKLKIENYLKKNFKNGIKPYGADALSGLKITHFKQSLLKCQPEILVFWIELQASFQDLCRGYRKFESLETGCPIQPVFCTVWMAFAKYSQVMACLYVFAFSC